jgi:hypothetical protein
MQFLVQVFLYLGISNMQQIHVQKEKNDVITKLYPQNLFKTFIDEKSLKILESKFPLPSLVSHILNIGGTTIYFEL